MPEEINRIMTDHVSSLLFCPTAVARTNLLREGISRGIVETGDVMYDVALKYAPVAERKSRIVESLGLRDRRYLLATIHRAENTDDRLKLSNVLTAFNQLSREIEVVLPLHPRTRKMICEYGFESLLNSMRCTEPLGFLDMLMLLRNAAVVATDSGGVQKEAYFQRVSCVTLRDQTEWVETLKAGWNVLASVDSVSSVIETIRQAMDSGEARTEIPDYGDGFASGRIVNAIKDYLRNAAVMPDPVRIAS